MELDLHRRVVGISSIAAGAVEVLFGGMSLLVVGLGSVGLSHAAAGDPGAARMAEMYAAMWSVIRLHGPIWLLHGAACVACGVSVLRGRRRGAQVLVALTLIAFAIVGGYVADLWANVMPASRRMFEGLQPGGAAGLQDARQLIVMVSVAYFMLAAYFAACLSLARRLPQTEAPKASPPAR